VVDSKGEPDSSGTLRLVPIGTTPPLALREDEDELVAETGDDGSFRFEVPAGRYRLSVKDFWGEIIYHPEDIVIEDLQASGWRAHETAIEFRMPKQEMKFVRGVVVDLRGAPAPNVMVHLSGRGSAGGIVFGKIATDESGTFTFETWPIDHEVWAASSTCAGVVSPRVKVGRMQTKPVVIRLPSGFDCVRP
jgi:hypothetical protein